VFEAAITGRASLDADDSNVDDSTFERGSSMIDLKPPTEEEMDAIRNAVINQEGLLLSVFDILRKVPRRVLMVLKLNDLTRSLDHALMTTHSNVRIFLITAKYCTIAVWQDDRTRLIDLMRTHGLLSWSLLKEYFSCWIEYERRYRGIIVVEMFMDAQAWLVKTRAWSRGLITNGLSGAHEAAAGLA